MKPAAFRAGDCSSNGSKKFDSRHHFNKATHLPHFSSELGNKKVVKLIGDSTLSSDEDDGPALYDQQWSPLQHIRNMSENNIELMIIYAFTSFASGNKLSPC
jgi:hypothetical protein